MDATQTIPNLFLDFMQMREFAKDPLVFVGGEGIRLTDSHGRRFIDGLSGVFVSSLGHGNMPVIEAMAAQARQLAFAPPLHSTTPPALALTELLVDNRYRVADVWHEALGVRAQLRRDRIEINGDALRPYGLGAREQQLPRPADVGQLAGADTRTRHAVDVGRADAVPGRAKGVFTTLTLGVAVHLDVIRQDQVRQVRQEDARCVDAVELERVELRHEVARRDDRARSDEAVLYAGDDATRHDAQLVGLVAHANRVPGVGAASEAGHYVGPARKKVDDASLAFIPPLGADDKGYGHEWITWATLVEGV